MSRIIRVGGALLAALTLILASGTAHADQRTTGLGLDIIASQDTYKPGDQITLTFRVTNHGTAPCQVGTVSDGEVLIGSVTRDGASQPWHTSELEYRVAYASRLSAALVTVPPDGYVDVAVHALAGPDPNGSAPLKTVNVLSTGPGLASAWTLGANGHYVVSARYKTPDLPGKTVCPGATNIATVAFAISSKDKAFPWLWLLMALVVLILLVLLLILLVRRRSRRAARATAAGALVVLAASALPAVRPTPALAGPGDFGIGAAVDYCMNQFTGPGIKPGMIDRIKADLNNKQLVIVPTDLVKADATTADDIVTLPGGRKIRLRTILWNPNDTAPYDGDPGATPDTCANLYHELVHADMTRDMLPGEDERTCAVAGYPKELKFTTYKEIVATEWENQYRNAKHLGIRVRYDEGRDLQQPVPTVPDSAKGKSPQEQVDAAMQACTPVDRDPAARPGDKRTSGSNDKPPSGSNGDPHLTTFDHLYYDFQAVGEFELAKSRDDFEVQVRQAPFDPADRTVAVNTAAAVRAGSDRIGFSEVDGEVQIRLGGKTQTLQKGSTKLPGGAVLARRSGAYSFTGDGYDVFFPDGSIIAVDPLGSEGLRVNVKAADARKGTFTGLLGNFDGKSAGDLVTRDGKTIADHPGYDDLYKVFGESWRLTQAESMLEYGPGQTTATFTDRTFPAKPLTVADLPQQVRDQATAMCKAAGVTDAGLLDDCIVDVARTGQPSFATAYAQDQADLNSLPGGGSTPPSGPSDPPADHGETKPGAILQDGDVVTGHIDQPGGTVDYGLNLTANEQFELVDVTGSLDAAVPDATVDSPMLPGPYQFAVQTNGQVKLRISLPKGPGKFSFRYVTLKPRTIPIEVGAPALSGNLDEPGRVDVYRFSPPADVTSVQVSTTTACEGGPTYGYSADTPDFGVRSPGQLCFGYAHPVSPGETELILVWSDGAKTESYNIGLNRS